MFSTCMLVCALSAYKVYGGQRRAADPLRQVTGCELPCGSWESKPGPMQQQQVLLTPKPSLSPTCSFQKTYFDKILRSVLIGRQTGQVCIFSVLPGTTFRKLQPSLFMDWFPSSLHLSSLPFQPNLRHCSCYLTSCACVTAFLCMNLEAELYWVL